MNKIALLVEFSPRTRVVVSVPDGMTVEQWLEDNNNYDSLVQEARNNMLKGINDYLSGENMNWEEDTECPFGSLNSDKPESPSRKLLYKLRDKCEEHIKEMIPDCGELYISDIDEGNPPILREGEDDHDTFTLDKIEWNGTRLLLSGSSSWTNQIWDSSIIDLEILIGVEEFLIEHLDAIKELDKKE